MKGGAHETLRFKISMDDNFSMGDNRRDERVTLWKDLDNIGTSHPPRCSLNSITRQTTQDTSDSASGDKRIKLELVPFMKEELVCLNEKSRTVLASTNTSSAGSRESYRNDIRKISAEPSKNSNVGVGFNHQQESDTMVKKQWCLSEMVDAIVRRNMLVLQDCEIADSRNSVCLNAKESDKWKALFSDLKNSSLGQQERHQNVLKTKPLILKRRHIVDKEATLDSVNSNAVQNCYRKISAESSSDSHFRVRSGHQQEPETTVKKLCLDDTVRRNMSLLQDCGSGEGIDGRSSASRSMKMIDHLKASSSDLIGDSLEQQGILQDVIDKQASFDHINSCAVQENRKSPIISVSRGKSFENVLLDRTDSRLASTRTAEGRYSPVRSFVSDNEIHRVSLNGSQQVEERICMRKNQECFLTVDTDDCVSQQEINENSSGSNSLETINQARVLSINTEARNFQLDKVENIMLRSSLCTSENLENDMTATLQKEGTDTHVRKSVFQEGIRSSTLEEKEKFSASSNTVSDSDTVNNCGKLRDDGDEGDCDSSDCDNSFSCHDCGSSFSCKNSLTDHISKQHNHAGQMNIRHATPPITVTLDFIDSIINNLSSFDVVSIHNTNTCDNVLQNTEENSKSLPPQGKLTEDALARHCNVPCDDGKDNEDTDNHVKTSVHQEGIKCSILEEKEKFSVSNNIVSECDGVNNCGKSDDDYDDSSFSCHDCGSSFSCKNSLSDHISKQHIHAGQTNILQVTPPNITVTLDCLDSTIEKLSSSDISVHNVKPCDNVLEKPDNNSRLLLAQGKPTEDAQASNCDVPSVDDNDKEDRDTHVRKEGIRCSVLEERGIVSGIDTGNNCGKDDDHDDHDYHDDGGGDSSDCVNSFSCHVCGSSFSCKNSLTDHIVKQHIHLGQTNTRHATPLTTVSVDCLDSTLNKLSSSDVASIHNTNTCDNSLQKLEIKNKSLLAQGKPTEDAQANSCNVPSIDDNHCTVIYNSTPTNTAHMKPIEPELKPTTIEEVGLMCEKYSKIICETSGVNPKINMINVKVELTSGNTYTSNNINYRKFFKPFIVLSDSRYNCQICEMTLNTRKAIVKHIGKHFNLFPFSCKFCDRRFTMHSCANEHMKIHYTKLICEQCGSVCKSSQYKKHILLHDKPFSCHDCGKSFGSKNRVRSHIWREHMKIRSHACKVCGKAYFHYCNVATHMIFAHGDRKIVCQYCGKMYFRNNMLKEHIRRWHN